MKNFKILKKSRFLTKEAMTDCIGGKSCTAPVSYSACSQTGPGHITCTPAAVQGYHSSACNGIADLHTCGSDMDYSHSLCWGLKIFTSSCGGGTTYFDY